MQDCTHTDRQPPGTCKTVPTQTDNPTPWYMQDSTHTDRQSLGTCKTVPIQKDNPLVHARLYPHRQTTPWYMQDCTRTDRQPPGTCKTVPAQTNNPLVHARLYPHRQEFLGKCKTVCTHTDRNLHVPSYPGLENHLYLSGRRTSGVSESSTRDPKLST